MGKEQDRGKTSYVVLRLANEGEELTAEAPKDAKLSEEWEVVGTVEAESGARAMRHFAELNERDGVYAAVPARSWVPSRVTLERTPRAVVSELRGA